MAEYLVLELSNDMLEDRELCPYMFEVHFDCISSTRGLLGPYWSELGRG
jgi:hypothetical protein